MVPVSYTHRDGVDTTLTGKAEVGAAFIGDIVEGTEILPDRKPVSYTHLDVYKRQDGGHRAGTVRHAEAFLGDQGVERLDASLGHGLSAGHLHALVHGLAPVSYTHLEVEKRQRCRRALRQP